MPDTTTPNQIQMQALWLVRKYELAIALSYFPPISKTQSCGVLELISDTGQQAQYLMNRGYNVLAFDLPSSGYRKTRAFDIQEYDGENLPTNDHSFDMVFSSNVLEHINDIDKVLYETYRVLKSGGIAIPLIPSPSCRGWSIFVHYIWLFSHIYARIFVKKASACKVNIPRTPQSNKELLSTFLPLRYGERGNTLTEICYFSEIYWIKKFKIQGIFYTLANAIGMMLPLKSREKIATILGSSCNIYVLEKI